MNPQVPDELISAFFDGEASPEERAVVERLLASSDDAQRELSETAKLSALLHSFPRESAPAELAGNILRQTDQLPLPTPPVTVATASATRNVWRDWTAGFLGAAVSATAMGLVIALNSNPPAEHHAMTAATAPLDGIAASVLSVEAPKDAPLVAMDDHSAELKLNTDRRSFKAERQEQLEERIEQAPAMAGASEAVQTATPRRAAKSALNAAPAPMAAKMLVDSSPPAPASAVAEPLATEPQTITVNELGQTNDEFLQSVSKGEVIALMPKAADPNSNVAVVYLQVVDIDRSAEQIQVLLKKNSITPRSYKKDSEATPNDLVAIYLEASGEKIANTLKDVERHPDLFPKWGPQAPLQVAAGTEEAEQILRKKMDAGRAESVDKTKQADSKGAESKEKSETPDVDIVLGALALRNSYQNGLMSNSLVSEPSTQNGRDASEKLQRQQISNSTRLMSDNDLLLKNGNAVSNGQLRELARVEPGYDFVRLNNSSPLTNSFGSNTPNAGQAYNNPFNNTFNVTRFEQQRRGVANYDAEKPANADTNNRALRMLFVLHPQPEATQSAAPNTPK